MAYDTIVSTNDSSSIQNFIHNKKVLVIGKRNIGKSYIIKHLIEILRQTTVFDLMVVVSKKEEFNSEYSDQFSNAYIYFNYIDELIDTLPNLCKINKNVLIVFEDIQIMDKNIQSRIDNLFPIKNLTMFASTQILPDSNFVDNFNYLLFAHENNIRTLSQNYKKINRFFNVDTVDHYQSSMEKLEDFDFMCIENVKNDIKEYSLPLTENFILNATIVGDNTFRNLDLIKSLISKMNSDKKTKIDNIIVISKSNFSVYSALTQSVYPGVSVVRKILKEQKFNREHYLIVFDIPFDNKTNVKQMIPELMFDSSLHDVSCIKIINEQCKLIDKYRFNTDLFIVNTNSPDGFTNLYNQIKNQKITLNIFNKMCDNICDDTTCLITTKINENLIQWLRIDELNFKQYPKIHFNYVDNFRNVYDLNHDNMHDEFDSDNDLPVIYDECTLNSVKKLKSKNQHLINQLSATESLIDMNYQNYNTDQILKHIKSHCNNIESLINSLI